MHCLSSLEVGQRVPDLRLLSNDSEDLPDAKSEHEIVRTLNWFIEKISGDVCLEARQAGRRQKILGVLRVVMMTS